MRPGAGRTALLIGVAAFLAAAGDASAAQRFAAPGGDPTAPCSAGAPCTLDKAVTQSRAGDEIVVAPGDYSIARTLDGQNGIDLHGALGLARPRLLGRSGLDKPVLVLAGGSVRHVEIDAGGTGSDADALQLRSGLGEDLVLHAADADGAELDASPSGTLLRDSVVTTSGSASYASGVDVRGASLDSGGAQLVNLTVLAGTGQAAGVACAVSGAPATLVNTYVRGARADVDAAGAGADCSATASDFRPLRSPGLTAGTGDVSGDGVFADVAAGDLRTLAGSPTIDAGTEDPLLGTSDAAGCPRSLGAGPDIGAFEYAEPFGSCSLAVTPAPTPTPTPEPTADPPSPTPSSPSGASPAPEPVQPVAPPDPPRDDPAARDPAPIPHVGSSVVVSVPRGTVRVRGPHGRRFRVLRGPMRVHVGSTVDATHGRVRLVSAIDADGTRQVGTFWGTRFRVRQRRHDRGMTTLEIVHAAGCRHRGHAGAAAVASAARHRRRHHARHKHRRSLWSRDDHGRFRTRGSSSVATARGTAWLTQERCTGTFTRVTKGAVAVRDRVRHRTVVVRSGHSYLARRRG